MRILFNNEIFESSHYCGVNKFYGLLLNDLQAQETVLQPACARNPFIDKNKFPQSIFYQKDNFYRDNKKLKLLNFLSSKFRFTKKICDHYIDKNKKLLSKRIYKNDFDIMHIDFCESPSNKIADRIIKNVKKPIVLMVHDMMTTSTLPNSQDYISKKHFAESKMKLLNAATKIITISNTTKQDLIKFFNVDANKISVVNSCYKKLTPEPCATTLPKKYILYVGKRFGHKNFRFFLTSIKDILLADSEIKLVFTLKHFDEEEKNYFSCLGILDSCIFVDALKEENLAYLYQNALCCAVPSLYEGFGMIALEAMNYGCPVIASNISAAQEVAAQAAIYFDPLQQHQIQEAVKKVIYDENLRQEMAKKGYERAKIFTVENSIKSLIKAYKQN